MITGVSVVFFLLGTINVHGDEPDVRSARKSTFANVVQQVESAVLPIYFQSEKGYGSGSAAMFHPDGYALTNSHVAKAESGVAVFNSRRVAFEVIGRSPEKDIAVIRFTDAKLRPWPFIQLGNSGGVMNGESVAVLGNPGGRGTVVTRGVVSGKEMFFPPISALAMTYYPGSRREKYLQYDAATNLGNSGGPVIDMDGRMIGLVAALLNREQNTSYAIPVDRVREYLSNVIGTELARRKLVGIKVDPQAASAQVQQVQRGSPAQKAGVETGDVIRSVNGSKVFSPSDWLVKLDQALRIETTVALSLSRDDELVTAQIKTEAWPVVEPVAVKGNTSEGLAYELYQGEFDTLPDFGKLRSVKTGHVKSLDLNAVRGDLRNRYALRFSGYLKVDSDGLYRITVTSDDGTRFTLNDYKLIDHDGVHPRQAASRLVRLKSGMHPLALEYFQKSGEASLGLNIELLKTPADFQTIQMKPQFLYLESETKDAASGS